MSNTENAPNLGFTSYQQDLFRRLVEEVRPGSAHIVIAPPGTGKSLVVASAITSLIGAGRITRVLLLAPAALTAQWAQMFARANSSSAVVDARELRLIRERSGEQGAGWPPGVSVMSMDLAKRDDVRAILATVTWELVVLDEAHLFQRQRRSLVEMLAKHLPAPALLLATATPASSLNALAPGAVTTDWTNEAVQLRAVLDQRLSFRKTLNYRPSEQEVALTHQVQECAQRLDRSSGTLLLRRAASSINALEETLIRLMEGDPLQRDQHAHLAPLLELVEQTRSDARLDTYKDLIHELAKDRVKHAITFCEYRATASYIAVAVEGLDYPTQVLHGGMTASQRNEALGLFASQGGLLIATDGASRGVGWNFVEAAIYFDVPWSAAAVEQREARYQRFGRTVPCTTYFFHDDVGGSAFENILNRLLKKHEAVREVLGIDFERELEKVLG